MDARLYWVGASVNEYYTSFQGMGMSFLVVRLSLVNVSTRYVFHVLALKIDFVSFFVRRAFVAHVFHLGHVHLNIQVSRCLLRVAACGWRTFV